MANDRIKSGIINERARLTANDLSLLNGVSEKINEDYLKNLKDIVAFNAAEQIRSGKEDIEVDIPFIGILSISRKILNTTKKNNGPSYKYVYDFKPSLSFYKSLNKAFENGDCDLPEILSEKYGKKLYNMYERFLGE